jgi:hypothetical protein
VRKEVSENVNARGLKKAYLITFISERQSSPKRPEWENPMVCISMKEE